MRKFLPACLGLFMLLQGCGGGGSTVSSPPLPPGKDVPVAAFQTYRTDHNGRNRVRMSAPAEGRDALALAEFDTRGRGPAGYLNLMDLTGTPYEGEMTLEVIAAVESGGTRATRLLRLTADQAAFVNERNGAPIAASGRYFFRGVTYAWMTIDEGPLLSGYHPQGLETLMIDFDSETASVNLRTGVEAGSDMRIELTGTDLPFNIRSGAWGGDVTIRVWDPSSPLQGDIAGSIRGNIGGTPGYAGDKHSLTTSGLYTGKGSLSDSAGDHSVSVDGIFFGRDPNDRP